MKLKFENYEIIGVSSGDSSFISIMQKGAEYGAVSADVAGKLGSYNYVFAEYKLIHGEKYEPSSRNINTQYAYERSLPAGECIEQVYSFVDSNTYADMAKDYRNYLFGDSAKTENKAVPVAIEIIGAISKVQQIFGMPKNLPYALTSYSQASDMIKSVKAYKLLEGARGTTPAQMNQIQETLLRLSQLVSDYSFIDELDINPLLISEKTGEGIAVDGRIKVRLEEAKKALGIECACGCC